jgi:rSAM/selenodomain-associated transferase 2
VEIAVVIPTLDEEAHVAAAVASAVGEAAGGAVDVVVADGGSRDATVARARDAGARIVASAPGRARQLNAGLEEAVGDAVVFLHADSRLPEGWRRAVTLALAEPAVAGGAFRLRFEGDGLPLRFLEWGVRLRLRFGGLPYGDQALFARRSLLDALGGVPEAPIMEDLDLAREIRRHGRLVILPLAVRTSARRYRGRVLRHMLRNWLALAGWRLGLDRARLAAWYAG